MWRDQDWLFALAGGLMYAFSVGILDDCEAYSIGLLGGFWVPISRVTSRGNFGVNAP